MIEPKKRVADMAVVPTAVKRPRTELVAAAQSQQLVAMVRRVLIFLCILLVTIKELVKRQNINTVDYNNNSSSSTFH